MMVTVDEISKKYAQAFLNLYYEKLDDRCIQAFVALDSFFKSNKKVAVYLNMPTIPGAVKREALTRMFSSLDICNNIKILINVLLEHRRIEAFGNVVHHIIRQYRVRRNIQEFRVITSHELSDDAKKRVIRFLEKKTGGLIIASFECDSSLIAGMRICGDYILWEHSVARQLRNVKNTVLQQVRSW